MVFISELNYCVYIHEFPDGKCYVGLTKQKPESRWQNGEGYKNQPVYEAIKDYGWNNINHYIVIDNISLEEAQKLEIELIKKFDSIKNGYNADPGGGAGGDSWVLFEYKNDIYTPEELLRFSNVENLTTHDLTTRINHHKWSIEDALNKPKVIRKKYYKYNDNYYTSKEIYNMRKIEISYKSLVCRLSLGWDVERAITQPTNVKLEPYGCRIKDKEIIYEYNGKQYNSHELLLLSPIENMTSSVLYNRIIMKHWDIEKALNTPLKKYNVKYEYNGKFYTTKELLKLSPLKNLMLHDITDRIRSGWSIEDVIFKPKRKSPTLKK